MIAPLGSLIAERRMVAELARRDIRARYAGARFGLLWSILNPAIQLISYSLIFGFFYRASQQGPSHLVAFLFCGLWPWWAFQDGTMRGLSALVDQADLLRRIPLAPEVCVAANVSAAVLLQALGFSLFLLSFGVIGLIEPRLSWLALPLLLGVGLMLSLGLGLLLAPLYAVVRDTLHVVSAALTVGFFASPVLYDLSSLPGVVQPLLALNPMAGLIGLYRSAVLGVELPSTVSLVALAAAVVGSWAASAVSLARIRGRLDEYW